MVDFRMVATEKNISYLSFSKLFHWHTQQEIRNKVV